MVNLVRCASPTCGRTIRAVISRSLSEARQAARDMVTAGWAYEVQPGDDRPRWYCERCRT